MKRKKSKCSKKAAYLEYLRQGLRRSKAAESVGVHVTTVWRWAQRDPDFANAIDQAELDSCEVIEDALFQKAKGGHVTAIQVWLYNRWPERWRDRRNLNANPLDAFLGSLPPNLGMALREYLKREGRTCSAD
jgi:hypothetical protein